MKNRGRRFNKLTTAAKARFRVGRISYNSILGPKKISEMIIIFIVCTILSEKITGGPSKPLAIIYFFKKTNTVIIRAENSY